MPGSPVVQWLVEPCVPRGGVDRVSNERELGLVVSDDAVDAVAAVDADLDLDLLACLVGVLVGELEHLEGEL